MTRRTNFSVIHHSSEFWYDNLSLDNKASQINLQANNSQQTLEFNATTRWFVTFLAFDYNNS